LAVGVCDSVRYYDFGMRVLDWVAVLAEQS
jgi:hypothetical protein